MKKKRTPAHDPHRPPPLVQVQPGLRARIDPTVVPQLSQWVLALRRRYEEMLRLPCGGLAPAQREARKGLISWARMMLRAYDDLLLSFHGTVDLRDLERARMAWDADIGRARAELGGGDGAPTG